MERKLDNEMEAADHIGVIEKGQYCRGLNR